MELLKKYSYGKRALIYALVPFISSLFLAVVFFFSISLVSDIQNSGINQEMVELIGLGWLVGMGIILLLFLVLGLYFQIKAGTNWFFSQKGKSGILQFIVFLFLFGLGSWGVIIGFVYANHGKRPNKDELYIHD